MTWKNPMVGTVGLAGLFYTILLQGLKTAKTQNANVWITWTINAKKPVKKLAFSPFAFFLEENGRGGWTRTNGCQDQNLMPYQLGDAPT